MKPGLRVFEFVLFFAAGWMQWRSIRLATSVPKAAILVSYSLLALGVLLNVPFLFAVVPLWWATWARGASLAWAVCVIVIGATFLLSSRLRPFDPGRRRLLLAGRTAICAAPIAATGFGILVRKEFTLREVEIPIRHLPPGLNGLRLVQVSDIHLSAFLTERELEHVVGMANDTRAHVALVTGDLITSRRDPLDACIRQIARLKADAGVLSCLGNHELYAEAEDYTTAECERRGLRVLRNQSQRFQFGNAVLNLAGVDYQSTREPYLMGTDTLVHRRTNTLNVLLSHNPDVFPVAAKQGFDLTISGHTHGGQVSFEILKRHVNIARFFTPYTYGLYREGDSAVYVTRGIGTVGIPARIGAPPEIALLRLCAT